MESCEINMTIIKNVLRITEMKLQISCANMNYKIRFFCTYECVCVTMYVKGYCDNEEGAEEGMGDIEGDAGRVDVSESLGEEGGCGDSSSKETGE